MIHFTQFATPLGDMLACSTAEHLCLLEFTDNKYLNKKLALLKKWGECELTEHNSPLLQQVQHQLNEYFDQKREAFSIPLLMNGTPFQKTVWQTLLSIKYGNTISYGKQAAIMNSPSAVRAVANANGRNMISILVPCHRVIGANGHLTGYAGGLSRKAWLLDLEKRAAPATT